MYMYTDMPELCVVACSEQYYLNNYVHANSVRKLQSCTCTYVCTVQYLKYFRTAVCCETEICPLVPTHLGETDSHLATERGRYLQALNIHVHVRMYSYIKIVHPVNNY